MRLQVDRLRVSEAVELPYVERGSPVSPPVIFLHGFAGSWRSFAPVLGHLPPSVRAVAPTLRGHADASKPASGYGVRDFADDVARLLDGLGIDAAVLVGHSMGSAIALRFALDHPARTVGLVLAGGAVPSGETAAVRQFFDRTVSRLRDPIDPAFLQDFLATTLAQPIPDELYEKLLDDARRVPARVWIEAFRQRLETDLSGEITRIAAPTLLVWGDQDRRVGRSDQTTLEASIRDARLIVYEGAGHDLHCEEPKRFAADVAAFVREVAG